MATARPFAYNTGAPIPGTEQVGSLAVGYPSAGFGGGLEWWNGPNEDIGYVIACSVPGDTQPTPVPGVSASVGFFRSSALTEGSFVNLANVIAAGATGTFTTGSSAKSWLNANGYWTSFSGGGSSTGNYNLLNAYQPAGTNGSITFPNHNTSSPSLNPNLVGQSGYAIYINQFDLSGADQSSVLDDLIGRSGTLTLTQGSNVVVYSFANNAFGYGGSYSNQYWWDNQFNSSPLGTITVTTSASGNFNTTDPIVISVS